MAIKLTTNTGKTILIEDKAFGKGGQGAVHHIIGHRPGMIAKIFYHETPEKLVKAKKLENRIAFMIRNSPLKTSSQSIQKTLIWPKEMLYHNGHFVGFVMPKAGDPVLNEQPAKLVSLCKERLGPDIRNKVEWQKFKRSQTNTLKTRLKLCYNIARAIDVLHHTKNYVVVDLKPDNILLNSNGRMSIIDLDSIQISKAGRLLYHGAAVTEEYIPPEWQKNRSNMLKASKNESWDLFSYAVLAYQLLLGIHPFTASHKRFQSPSEFICEGLFPNGSRKREFLTISPPHKGFNGLPREIQVLFLRCFEDGYRNPNIRPSLKEWASTLVNILQRPPKIHSFKASTPIRRDASPVRISWQVENAGRMMLNKRPVTGKSHINVSPVHDTTYILEVSNGTKSVSSQIQIKVDRTPPQIDFFQADKYLLTDHHPALLSWNTKRAGSISLNEVGDVSNKTSCVVTPKKDTEYCLKVTGYFGQVVTQRLQIKTSKNPPQILAFESNIYHREDDRSVYLKWRTKGALRLYINTIGDVSKMNTIKIDPRKDTDYYLRAISYFGIESRSHLRITISKKPPIIKRFDATPNFLSRPKEVQLIWETSKASKIKLFPDNIEVTGKSNFIMNPMKDTRYYLKALSYFGIESTAECSVKVSREPPSIFFFHSAAPLVVQGSSTHLVWSVDQNAKSVIITPDIGEVECEGRVSIKPQKDSIYIITVKNHFGYGHAAQVKIKVIEEPKLKGTNIKFKSIPSFKEFKK